MPEYTGEETPTKTATAQYTYTFNGKWEPTIVEVTEDAEYVAQFDSEVNQYYVTFVDDDGTELKAATPYDYGTPAEEIVQPEYPTKDAGDGTIYIFVGWDPELAEVTEDITYTAKYEPIEAQLTGTGEDTVYDGKGHTATFELVTDIPTEETEIEYYYNGNLFYDVPSFVNAGTYEVTAKATLYVTRPIDEEQIEIPLEATATINITKRAIAFTSGSASKAYDGTALTYPYATMTSGSLAEGDTYELSFTGTITDVGSTPNTFTVDFGRAVVTEEDEEDNRPSKQVNGFDINDNYAVTLINGTLTITGGPTPPPTPPTPPTFTVDPTPTPAAPTPAAAPVATPAVLGATREVEELVPEEPAVLGESRTRQTGDESQIPVRVLLIMICAGAIITIMMTNRKKEEQ